jgi:hypothetical protein
MEVFMKGFKSLFMMTTLLLVLFGFALCIPGAVNANQPVRIFLDGFEIQSDVPPMIVNDRTMLPVRAISEALNLVVDWDNDKRQVIISSNPAIPVSSTNSGEINYDIAIMGNSVVSSEDLKALLKVMNPNAIPELVDLYLAIGSEYGIRGDIAFCQAAKETGWWKYGGLVEPHQNNYCGLSATGKAAAENEDLRGANPAKVWFEPGKHGAFFDSPATGVEAHIQHLYAYATDKPLPSGKELLSPRYVLISRGSCPKWIDLGGKWAVPGYDRDKYESYAQAYSNADTYGHSILKDYYQKALQISSSNTVAGQDMAEKIKSLERENELLKIQVEQLKSQLGNGTKI